MSEIPTLLAGALVLCAIGGVLSSIALVLIWWPRHKHTFEKLSFGKRRCTKCGEEQWLMLKSFPMPGEPASSWKTMWNPKAERRYDKRLARQMKRGPFWRRIRLALSR